MATESQYEFFKSLYEEEERTADQLQDKAKLYLGIISAFLVAILLKTQDTSRSFAALHISFTWILIEGILMSASLVCVVFALRVRAFEAINDAEEIIEGYGDDDPDDQAFWEDRIADYAVASTRNRRINNQTSVLLAWGARFLIGGMLLLFGITIFALWRIHG